MTRHPSSSHLPITRLRQILIVAGVVEVALGFLHFLMPPFYRKAPGLNNLSSDESDFVVLVTYAVGILLIAFGATTLSFARHPARHLELLVPYLIIKCALWTARLCLELIYPVRLEMFAINPFTAIVLPGVAVELLMFIAAAYLSSRNLSRMNEVEKLS